MMTPTNALLVLAISIVGAAIHTRLWELWTAHSRRKTNLMLENYREQIQEARLILEEMQSLSDEKKLFPPGWQSDYSSACVHNYRASIENCESAAQNAEGFLKQPHHYLVVRARRHLKRFTIHLNGQKLLMQKTIRESKTHERNP